MNKVEKFKKFLEDNNAYEAFVSQMTIPYNDLESYVNILIEADNFDGCVCGFANWEEETKEGFDYWEALDLKWQEVCDEE